MAIFNSFLYVYQRVRPSCSLLWLENPEKNIEKHGKTQNSQPSLACWAGNSGEGTLW